MLRLTIIAMLFFSFNINVFAIPTEERNALIALYNSTDGKSWQRKSNWLTYKGGECNWYGVTCDSNNNILSLVLVANNLSGSIPAELGNLNQLQSLGLGGNNLTGSIPAELGQLNQLQSLKLGANNLTGSIPAELGNLNQLQFLSLADNELKGSIPAELGNLSQLISLYLDENQLSGSIPAELGNLSQLQTVDLGRNQLTGLIPPELGMLSQLKKFLLGQNQLSGTIPSELGNLSQLESLMLNTNQLNGVLPESLMNLNQIRGFGIRIYNNPCLYSDNQSLIYFLQQLDTLWIPCADIPVVDDPVNTPPSIILTPSPDDGFKFQRSIAENGGFGVVISDSDGLDDVDYSSIKIFNFGVDITNHFFGIFNQLKTIITPYKSEGSLLTTIRVDPGDFMKDQNLFKIPHNGNHKIKLKVCDKSGACDFSEYVIYIGPFVTADKIQIGCVVDGYEDFKINDSANYYELNLTDVIISNIGYKSESPELFLILKTVSDAYLHFEFLGSSHPGQWIKGLDHTFTLKDFYPGETITYKEVDIPLVSENYYADFDERESIYYKLTTKNLKILNLWMAIYDRKKNAYRIDNTPLKDIKIEPCDFFGN